MKTKLLIKIAVLSCVFLVCFSCTDKTSQNGSITIKVDKNSIRMGRSVMLTAHLNLNPGESANDYLLLPYVNNRRWGSHERPDANGDATFLLPLPNPGKVEIQVIAVRAEPDNWMGTSNRELLMAGKFMPDSG